MTNEGDVIPLMITSDWYIPVDDTGRCLGPCYEGALGFVLQVTSRDGEHFALKFPKMMGETHRENGYIVDLTEQEAKLASSVYRAEVPEALLEVVPTGRGVLRTKFATDDQENMFLFASFERGRNPLFCSAVIENGMIKRILPEKSPLQKVVDKNISDLIPEFKARNPIALKETYFVEFNTEHDQPKMQSGGEYEGNAEDDQVSEDERNENLTDDDNQGVRQNDSRRDSTDLGRAYSSEESFDIDAIGATWHIGLPSIVFRWAEGTFQEAITLKLRGKWKASDQLDFLLRIGKSLDVLHRNGILHADLRPANILYLKYPSDTTNYSLADYGSYALVGSTIKGVRPPVPPALRTETSALTKGPVVSGERASPFYAPERGFGKERETTNTAVLFSQPNDLYVVLGWRNVLINEDGSVAVELEDLLANSQYVEEHHTTEMKSSEPGRDAGAEKQTAVSLDRLKEGDRIQVRDYIFELKEDEKYVEQMQIFRCKPESWRIYQGRIVVKNTDVFTEKQWFPIPRVIELRQWSAASDIYSLGAIALYSIFLNFETEEDKNSHTAGEENASPQDGPDYQQEDSLTDYSAETANELSSKNTDRNNIPRAKRNIIELENNFQEMIKNLSSRPYFETIWDELNWIREQIEQTQQDPGITSEALPNVLLEPYDRPARNAPDAQNEQQTNLEGQEASEPKTILGASHKAVERITMTVPGTRELLEALDDNLGYFIFFIHFVLCCLHRQDNLPKQDGIPSPASNYSDPPFCKDRLEPPVPENETEKRASEKACERLVKIKEIINKGELEHLKPTTLLLGYDPKPVPKVRLELIEANSELAKLRPVVSEKESLQDLKKNIETEVNEIFFDKPSPLNVFKLSWKNLTASKQLYEIKKLLRGHDLRQANEGNNGGPEGNQ